MMRDSYDYREWWLMKLFFGVLWLAWVPLILFNYSGVPEPTGLGLFIDLSFLSCPWVKGFLMLFSCIITYSYIKGLFQTFSTFSMFVVGVFVHTYMDAQGSYHHTELIQLVLFGQLIVFIKADLKGLNANLNLPIFNLAIRNSKQLIMATYLVSGITKLTTSGLGWIDNSPRATIHMIKSFTEFHYTFDLPWVIDYGLNMTEFATHNPIIVKCLFAVALFFELFGFLATIEKKASFWVGVWFLAFHLGLLAMLGVFFVHYFLMVLVFMVNVGACFKSRPFYKKA